MIEDSFDRMIDSIGEMKEVNYSLLKIEVPLFPLYLSHNGHYLTIL